MDIETVKEKMEEFVTSNKSDLSATIDKILRLYADIRMSSSLDESGDMLLFQWGTYDWGEGNFFEFDITRQVILAELEGEEPEESIKQLNVTFKYSPNTSSQKLKDGNTWCESPSGLSEFQNTIFESSAYQWCVNQKPVSVVVNLDDV